MAKIRDSNPKNSSGGYLRLLGNENMADIFIKTHSTNIRNGNELEEIIINDTPDIMTIKDLDDFIEKCRKHIISKGFYLCPKKVIDKSQYKLKKHQPDLMILILSDDNICHILELKDGDDFDTKKSQSEKEALVAFKEHIQPKIQDIFNQIDYKICCFNQTDKQQIVKGLKKKFTIDEVITGKELCDMLQIDYEEICKKRQEDTKDNFKYIIEEMCKLVEIKNYVNTKQRSVVCKNDFYSDEDD